MQFTWLDAKLHLINEHLIKYLFQSPPLRLLQIEGILHLRSQMSKTYTVLQNPGFPQPAYKKQFVLCSFLPRILMQAIRLLPLCRSDNYQNSYVQFLFQACVFFFFSPFLPCIPYLLIYVFPTADVTLVKLQSSSSPSYSSRGLTAACLAPADPQYSAALLPAHTHQGYCTAREKQAGTVLLYSKAPTQSHLSYEVHTVQHKGGGGRSEVLSQ